MDQQTLNTFAQSVDDAALKLPHAANGRQNDPGAKLVPAGVLIVPMFIDPSMPGKVFAIDLVEMRAGRLGVHEVETIRDGEVGNAVNVAPATPTIDLTNPLLQLLAGHLLPGILPQVLSGGDPLALLGQLAAVFGRKELARALQGPPVEVHPLKLRPLGDRVIVQVIEEKEKTDGGIYLPATAEKDRPFQGRVMSAGPGKFYPGGEPFDDDDEDSEPDHFAGMEVGVGDIVIFSKFAGTEVTLEGEKYLILKEDDIHAVVEK